MGKADIALEQAQDVSERSCPLPPPLPALPSTTYVHRKAWMSRREQSMVSSSVSEVWDRLFDECYGADVVIQTDIGGCIYAHAGVLGTASPVMKAMLSLQKNKGRKRVISIRGVPHNAVSIFIRFLYSSCYELKEMKDHVLHLLTLSHAFSVPRLKNSCVKIIEQGYLTTENVVDIFQLALLCDAPRISLMCHRMISKSFRDVHGTEGWQAMKLSHPVLEKQLMHSIQEEEKARKERVRKWNERKIYLQLYEVMEALVHICRDGCRTIGPFDKEFKQNQAPCNYSACSGLESLIRHFAGCKLRVPGGCNHCKRMWQLLELHSRLCTDSSSCRVPLCKSFKERIRNQSKKDEVKWRILVKNILRTKGILGTPLFI